MTQELKNFAETYTMRSRFYHDLGESAKKLADTYTWDADLGNRAAFVDLVRDAVRHSLIEHHGFTPEELDAPRAGFATIPDPQAFMEAARGMREALEVCQSTLRHTRAFMLQKHGTTNPAREEALADAEAALATFDATLGEQ